MKCKHKFINKNKYERVCYYCGLSYNTYVATILPELLQNLKDCRDIIYNLINEIDPAYHTQFDGGQEIINNLDKVIARAKV